MNSALSEIQKETVAFIVGGCTLIGISTQAAEPYRMVIFTVGLIMIPLSFVWNYMENRSRRVERQELERKVQEQVERMKVKCPRCNQAVIPKKVGENYFCPSCNNQFKSTSQTIEEWEKGLEFVSKLAEFLKRVE